MSLIDFHGFWHRLGYRRAEPQKLLVSKHFRFLQAKIREFEKNKYSTQYNTIRSDLYLRQLQNWPTMSYSGISSPLQKIELDKP
jgi:hypothetical protein